MTDIQASLVMKDIVCITLTAFDYAGEYDHHDIAQANAMLNHLYSLHKLRDERIMYNLCNTRAAFPIRDLLLEMNGY
jgi:hypothetical protein